MKKGARAALQFYPETANQVEMITAAALKCGFGGGLVVDYPHSAKAKKHFLVIYAGFTGSAPPSLPRALNGDEDEEMEDAEQIHVEKRQRDRKGVKEQRRNKKNSKEWILEKKESQRR